MKTNEFNWHGGQVTFRDLDPISDLVPLAQQIDSLKEDMAQVHYPNNSVLDIGWYPEFTESGHFAVFVIKDANWENPIHYSKCTTVSDLRTAIPIAVQAAIDCH